MNVLLLITAPLFLLFAVLFWQFRHRDKQKWALMMKAIFGAAMVYLLGTLFLPWYSVTLWFWTLFIIAHFQLRMVPKLRNPIFYAPAIVLSAMIIFVLPREEIIWGEYSWYNNDWHMLLFVVLGALLPETAFRLVEFLNKFFQTGYKNVRAFQRGWQFILLGLTYFIADFLGAEWAIYALLIGRLCVHFYRPPNQVDWNFNLVLMAFLLVPLWLKIGMQEQLFLKVGRNVQGLLLGMGLAYLYFVLLKSRKNRKLSQLLIWMITLIVPFSVVAVGEVYNRFGGFDSLSMLLLGYALVSATGIDIKHNNFVFSMIVGVGLTAALTLKNKPVASDQTVGISTSTQPKEETLKLIPLDEQGLVPFSTPASSLTFELGPVGGRTKGTIEKFSGEMTIEGQQITALSAVFDMTSLTTFNSYRDESLMEEAYFHVAKYPTAQFKLQSVDIAGLEFQANGQLTMLGKTNEVPLQLKKVEKDGKAYLMGSGQFNRTNFGMKSDPKEGNVVDFIVWLAL